MKWEDFREAGFPSSIWEERTQVDVECPLCGKKVYRRNDIVLTSYPAQYRYECDCGWSGSAYR